MTLTITAEMAEIINLFDATEAGQLTLAMLAYIQGGEQPDLFGALRIAWVPLRQAIDAQMAQHERKAAAGRAGGRPKAAAPVENPVENQTKSVDNQPVEDSEKQKKADESREKQTKGLLLPAVSRASKSNIYYISSRRDKDLPLREGCTPDGMLYCHSLYADWWREIDPEERQLDHLTAWLASKRAKAYTRAMLTAAFTVTEKKTLSGKLRDPLAYLISLCADWDKRGLRTRAEIEQYLDLTPGPSAWAQRTAEA